MKKIYYLLIGLFLVVIDVPIYTDLEFPVRHLEEETIARSFSVEVIEQLLGSHFYIDILPDVLGYILMAVVAWKLLKFHGRFKHIMYSSVAAAVCTVVIMALPYLPLEPVTMVGAVALCKAVDYFCVILIVFSLAKAVYGQVDGYMYLEMWNDFKTDWNIMAIAPLFIYILGIAAIVDIPVISALAIIIYGIWLYAAVHFMYYVYSYSRKLNLF